jgi:hypothetical protein
MNGGHRGFARERIILTPPDTVGAFAFALPAGFAYLPLLIHYLFTASAAVANRFARLEYQTAAGLIVGSLGAAIGSTPVTAAQIRRLTWYPGAAEKQNGASNYEMPLPRAWLVGAEQIRFSATNLDAADAFSEVRILTARVLLLDVGG